MLRTAPPWIAATLLLTSEAGAQQIKPYIFLDVDTSSSMLQDTCGTADVDESSECAGSDVPCATCNATGCGNGIADDGRLFLAKRAARSLVDSFGEVTFGLARFHQDPAPFSCKGGGWLGAAAGCGGDAVGIGSNRADVLVPIMPDNQDELVSWIDGCDDWPTPSDCDPVTNLAPDTGCALCADCGAGCDKEVRAHGDAPIAGGLYSLQQYLENTVMPADPAAGCRSYDVFLFSDGLNTCPGDAAAQAAALCAVGVPVHVVGFDDPALLPALDAIAQAGCGPACATGPDGQPRCDGQLIPADDETALSTAVAGIVQASILVEKCNGMDDNCNGLTDEDFPGLGQACCDPCAGRIVCNAAQDGTICNGVGPCPEICNGIDDNCNGLVDEGIDPPCVYEVCNGIDDDGDGLTDELPLNDIDQPCGNDEGECSMGVTCCQGGVLRCCAATGPSQEICDCLDNDCDALTDDGPTQVCFDGPAASCPDPWSGECVGLCRPGTHTCSTAGCPGAPGWGPCVGQIGPRPEECNCLDDDCNGLTDDGATCTNGAPCVDCRCLNACDPGTSFPCPAGYFCDDCAGTTGERYCIPDPCPALGCGPADYCDACAGGCVSLCEGVDCGGLDCCAGDCCEPWQTCQDLDGDGLPTCDDTSCTNPRFPCAEDEVCIDHACIPDPCAGVDCGDGMFCLDGTCRPVCPDCAPAEICRGGLCVRDPCAGFVCDTSQVCCDGRCVADPCPRISCDPGRSCDACAGTCVDDPCPRMHCPTGYSCDRGECIGSPGIVTAIAGGGGGGCECGVGGHSTSPWPWALLLLGALVVLRGRRSLCLALLLIAPLARAQVKPYIVMDVDSASDMLSDTCGTADVDETAECAGADVACATCNATGCGNGVADDSRLFLAKRAVRSLVDSFGEVTFGLARFHQDPAPFSCKGGGWLGASPACGGAGVGAGENAADLLVPVADDNQNTIAGWLDGCDDWPAAGDCDATLNLAPDTGCALCADCGAACDQEVRGTGDAALAGSLYSVRQYLLSVEASDPQASCRSYAAMLFTDGVNACAGDAPGEAAALCADGIPVIVVGYDDPALLPALQAIATAGCGPACRYSHTGQTVCDGQVAFADDDVALSAAVERIAQASVLRELCNGFDDDCDGLTDEDFPDLGQSCCDPCPGTIVCNAAQDGTMCSGVGPCPEVCNNLDDNCNGLTDEGLICEWFEFCNGIDDDGDGLTDEPPLPDVDLPCGTDEGECSAGLTCCQAGVLRCCGAQGPTQEVCDCLDNDCDTQTDERLARVCYDGPAAQCPDPSSGACVGLCRPGIQTCSTADCPDAPGWGPCVGQIGPHAEECNSLDDDCNGLTDDGATCPGGRVCVNGDCAWTCDCGSLDCCAGTCCEAWQTCRDGDGDGVVACEDTSCTNPSFPCFAGEVCVDHTCVPDPCHGVVCGPEQFCLDGKCHDVCPLCAPDQKCVNSECVPDPCAEFNCPTETICCNRACVADPCAAGVLECDPGQYCDGCNATCRENPCPRIECPSCYGCQRGECLPVTDCGPGGPTAGGGGCACGIGGASAGGGWFSLALGLLAWRRRRT
jgi:MYXO-CTERM domain-containing protein